MPTIASTCPWALKELKSPTCREKNKTKKRTKKEIPTLQRERSVSLKCHSPTTSLFWVSGFNVKITRLFLPMLPSYLQLWWWWWWWWWWYSHITFHIIFITNASITTFILSSYTCAQPQSSKFFHLPRTAREPRCVCYCYCYCYCRLVCFEKRKDLFICYYVSHLCLFEKPSPRKFPSSSSLYS